MSTCILPRLRDVHAILGDTGGTFNLTDLILMNDLWFGIVMLVIILFGFHTIAIGINSFEFINF